MKQPIMCHNNERPKDSNFFSHKKFKFFEKLVIFVIGEKKEFVLEQTLYWSKRKVSGHSIHSKLRL